MTAQCEMYDYEIEAFNQSQTAKIIDIRKKRMAKENAKHIAFQNFVGMLTSVAIVIVIAALFSSYVYKNSLVNEAKYDIFNLKAEIKSLNAKSEELSADIENQTELKNIEQIAIDTLNMQYPTKEQIVYIDSNYHFALLPISAELVEYVSADSVVAGERAILNEFVIALFNTKK